MKIFTDPRDGKKYKTVKIGEQIWMAQNLNYEAEGSLCYNDYHDMKVCPSNSEKYGRLYNWETAMKVCPAGWHLPSDAEWQTLIDFIGGATAGEHLKAKRLWNRFVKISGNGTDAFKFSALPAGYKNLSGEFYGLGKFGVWWSSTEYGSSSAYIRSMYYDYEDVNRFNLNKSYLFSVRCLQD